MTNIGHFRAAGKLLERHGKAKSKLWIVPPTRMDEHQLTAEGYYDIFKNSQAQVEIPGCSLCMGNQARAADGATMVSTSTRNFPNRMGDGCNVYLASSEVTAISSLLGKNFDIHGGGLDLIFPHHENEIAQSCCANKVEKFANYWLHNGYVTFNKEKMSKSLGNIVTIEKMRKTINGQVIRFALLSSHYKQPLDWNENLIKESQNTLDTVSYTHLPLPTKRIV